MKAICSSKVTSKIQREIMLIQFYLRTNDKLLEFLGF